VVEGQLLFEPCRFVRESWGSMFLQILAHCGHTQGNLRGDAFDGSSRDPSLWVALGDVAKTKKKKKKKRRLLKQVCLTNKGEDNKAELLT